MNIMVQDLNRYYYIIVIALQRGLEETKGKNHNTVYVLKKLEMYYFLRFLITCRLLFRETRRLVGHILGSLGSDFQHQIVPKRALDRWRI
jgi:hypothetical protein